MKNTKTIRYKETVYTNFFPPLKSRRLIIIIIRNGISIPAPYILSFSHDAINARKKKFQFYPGRCTDENKKRDPDHRGVRSRRFWRARVSPSALAPCVRDFELLSLSLCPRNSFFHDRRPRWKLVQQTSDGKYSWRLKRWAIFFRWSILTRIRKGFFPDILADIGNRTRMVRA